MQKAVKIIFKTIGWILLSVLFLLFALYFIIQVPAVQNYLKNKVVNYVEGKIHTKFSIGKIALRFSGSFDIEKVYLQDQRKDTLLYADRLNVRFALLPLLRSTAEVKSIELDDVNANILRTAPDTIFNYQYIIDAFASPSKDSTVKDSSGSNFSIDLQSLVLRNIRANYSDDATGNQMLIQIGHAETSIRRMNLQKLSIDISAFLLENSDIQIRQYVPLVQLSVDSLQQVAQKQKDTSSQALPLHIGKVTLAHIHFSYVDQPGAMRTDLQLGKLALVPGNLDLAKMAFQAHSILLDSTKVYVGMGKSSKKAAVADTSAPLKWLFQVEKIGLHQVDFAYDDSTAKRISKGMDYSHLNFKNVVVEGKDLQLTPAQYTGEITKGSLTEKGGLQLKALRSTFLYNDHGASLGKLFLQTNRSLIRDSLHVAYPSLAYISKHPEEIFIYGHLPHVTIAASDILAVVPMLQTYMGGYANSIFHLNTVIKGKVKDLQIPNLELSGLQHTVLQMNGYLRGLPDPNKLVFDLNIKKLVTSIADIQALVPKGMLPPMQQYGNGLITMKGSAKGKMDHFSIPAFEMRGLNNTYVNLSGRASGLPNVKKAYFDFKIRQLTTSAKEIAMLAPKGTIPYNKIRIPAHISANGFFRGSLANLNTLFHVKTTNGNAMLAAQLNKNGNFNTTISVDNFNAGYVLRMDTIMGKISADVHADGSGLNLNKFNLNRLVANFNGNISSADVYQYNYRNLQMDGSIANSIVNANAQMQDPNIRFDLHSTADIHSKYPALQLNLQLDTLNLDALHIVKDTMRLRGNILADFSNTNPDQLNGSAVFRHIDFLNDSMHLQLDSGYFAAKTNDSLNQLVLSLDNMARVEMAGKYKLTEVPYALQNIIQKYYSIPGYKMKRIAPQEWTLNGFVNPTQNILQWMPALKGSDSLLLSGKVSTVDSSINFNATAGKIVYGPQKLNNISIKINTENDSLKMTAGARSIQSPSFSLWNTGIRTAIANNRIDFGLGTLDSLRKPMYGLGGILAISKDSGYMLHLKESGLILNYDRWQTSPDNQLVYNAKKGIFAKNFNLSTEGQSIELNSASDSINAPLDVSFNHFKLATLTHIANMNDLPVGGDLNGTAQLRNILKRPVFVSDITAANLSYGKDSVGDLTLKVNNEKQDIYTADIQLHNQGNDLRLTGDYYHASDSLDLQLALNNFNLAKIVPFSMKQLDSAGGFLQGNATVTGKLDAPVLNGVLHFDSAFFKPTMTGAILKLPNENIKLDPDGLHFNRFTIRDENNNRFRIDGDLLTKTYRDYSFAMRLRANKFTLINAAKADGRFFYGKLNLNSDLQLGGDMNAPMVNGLLHVNKETNFSMIMPSDDPEVEDRKGIVTFIDPKRKFDSTRVRLLTDSLSNKSNVKGMDINLTIETDTLARFALIIDERTGDALSVRGDADLAFGIDPSGKMSLTGAYTLNAGSYQMTMPMLTNFSKKFTIQKGSSINWTGDPLSAIADIAAIYSVNTAPIDLLSQQLSGTDLTTYKQNLPFSVYLKLKNNLMKPDISFDVTLPDDILSQWPLVDTKLQQLRTDDNELNKQVVALLLLGRFVGENPLQSAGASTSVGDMARQNAGRILSDQLNKLATSLIQGVDLNFDLNSGTDYSTGQAQSRTDLNVKLSKRLFNDRISVNVGSDFALEGVNSNQQATNIAGDISVDYRLSQDGTYMLRAYRKNKYEGVIEGQVVSTGVGFVFTLDYNQFKELFESTAKRQRRLRQEERGTKSTGNAKKKKKNKNKSSDAKDATDSKDDSTNSQDETNIEK